MKGKDRGPGSFINESAPQKPQFPSRTLERVNHTVEIFVIDEGQIRQAKRICKDCSLYLAPKDGGDISMRCDGVDNDGVAQIRQTKGRSIQMYNSEVREKVVRRAACLTPADHERLRQLFRT